MSSEKNTAKRVPAWVQEANDFANRIRRRVLEHTLRNNGGYMSQACSAAELLATLYLKVMNLGPVAGPKMPEPFQGVPGPANQAARSGAYFNGPGGDFDRFFLSPSQYALVVYVALIEAGRMAPEALLEFNKDGSTVEMIGAEHSPGMEVMSGSLGQGLSQAGGIALGRRLKGEIGKTWVFMSDGEWQSGQNWEAMQALSFHKLDTVGIYIDLNGQQCDGTIDQVMRIEPFAQRLKGFGARVLEVDGHDPAALARPAKLKPDGRPLVVLAKTDPCRNLPRLNANAPKLHYLRFKSPEEKNEYAEILKNW